MTKIKIVFIIIMMFPLGAAAQKKQLSQARDILKEGKTPEKAEAIVAELLKDSANRDNIKIWGILFNAQTMKYEQYNEKQYLQKEQDTVALFNTALKMFRTAQSIDSLDRRPDKKGNVQPRFRQHNSSYLNIIRPNLYNGGVYAIRQQRFKDAVAFFEQYLDCARLPMFSAYEYAKKDSYMPKAAYWAMFCCRHLGYDDDVLAYSKTAFDDTLHLSSIMQYRAEAFSHKNDTSAYVEELRQGFDLFPLHPYFFPRLVEYYEQLYKYDDAIKVVDKALEKDSLNTLFRFAKSNLCLNTKRYDECIAICDKILEEPDPIADAYYNIGLAYFNKAIEIEKLMMGNTYTRSKRRSFQEQKEKLYRQSLGYLETFRSIAPEKQKQWAVPLYTIYLNLNMGKEFEEIEKMRR